MLLYLYKEKKNKNNTPFRMLFVRITRDDDTEQQDPYRDLFLSQRSYRIPCE